jgi:hypothetical protein
MDPLADMREWLLIASANWYGVSLRLRPNLTPFASACSRPSLVRSRISSSSNSAIAAKRVDGNRPRGLEVSNSGSPKLRKFAPALVI